MGIKTKAEFDSLSPDCPEIHYCKPDYPVHDEQYFEWIDLLQAVITAEEHFTMIELGAGFGRWICNAAAALKQVNDLPCTLIGMEAEPTHFGWMKEHLQVNGVDPNCCQLIQAAVAAQDGEIGFEVGQHPVYGGPKDYYGQAIGGKTLVKAISLNTLLQPLKKVDLIDLDVQGAEYDVLKTAADVVHKKVKRIHIETHNRYVELGLRELFARMSWININDYPCTLQTPGLWECQTDFGLIKFQGGVQTWVNPRFTEPSELFDIIARTIVVNENGYGYDYFHQRLRELQQKLSESEQKLGKSGQMVRELEQKLDESLMLQQQIRNSPGWRVLERFRIARDRLLPQASFRRRVYDAAMAPFRR